MTLPTTFTREVTFSPFKKVARYLTNKTKHVFPFRKWQFVSRQKRCQHFNERNPLWTHSGCSENKCNAAEATATGCELSFSHTIKLRQEETRDSLFANKCADVFGGGQDKTKDGRQEASEVGSAGATEGEIYGCSESERGSEVCRWI